MVIRWVHAKEALLARKLVVSLLVLSGFTALAFGSLDPEVLEEIVEELD